MSFFRKTSIAYGKINFLLRIVGVRKDGYHLISTVMQSISLADKIDIAVDFSQKQVGASPEINLSINACAIASDSTNTMYKAAAAYFAKTGQQDVRADITAHKAIPPQAGLGGGSADAAAVLCLLNEAFSEMLSRKELIDVATRIGADVPFFMDGGTALCEGIGERITPLQSLSDLWVLIIQPTKGVSTPAAYALYDQNEHEFSGSVSEDLKLMHVLGPNESDVKARFLKIRPFLYNDLQTVAIQLVPDITKILHFFRTSDCLYSAVTGSGSAVFGIYSDSEKRDLAHKEGNKIFGDKATLISCQTVSP